MSDTPATKIVHWPGEDVPACDEHAQQLKLVGEMLAGFISTSPAPEGMVCTNCTNEAKR